MPGRKPKLTPEEEKAKQKLLRLAAYATKKANKAKAEQIAAFKAAARAQASSRELEAATGVPYRTAAQWIGTPDDDADDA